MAAAYPAHPPRCVRAAPEVEAAAMCHGRRAGLHSAARRGAGRWRRRAADRAERAAAVTHPPAQQLGWRIRACSESDELVTLDIVRVDGGWVVDHLWS